MVGVCVHVQTQIVQPYDTGTEGCCFCWQQCHQQAQDGKWHLKDLLHQHNAVQSLKEKRGQHCKNLTRLLSALSFGITCPELNRWYEPDTWTSMDFMDWHQRIHCMRSEHIQHLLFRSRSPISISKTEFSPGALHNGLSPGSIFNSIPSYRQIQSLE